jgi:Zn-dependent protease with chaperone function
MRGDREYRNLLLASGIVVVALAAPLAITLFPGELQRLLHGSDVLILTCATFVYSVGERLPPLGFGVLSVAAASAVLAASCASRLLSRTRRAIGGRRAVSLPRRLRRAGRRVGVTEPIFCFTDARASAYCAGLIHPAIWISTGAVRRLRSDELEAVLLHESHHARRRDPLRIVVARILGSALVAVPLIRDLGERFEVAAELDADRATVLAQQTVAPIAGALYKLGAAPDALTRRTMAVSPWSASQARVDQLSGLAEDRLLPRPSRAARLTSAVGLALILLLGLGQALRANLVPASLLAQVAPAADAHICPLPIEGILL